MATSLEDVIRYLRTSGGTSFGGFPKASFSDFSQINFAVDVDRDVGMTLQEQANAELAFKMWRELIAKPTEIQRTIGEENIVYYFSDDLEPGQAGIAQTTRIPQLYVQVIINRDVSPEDTTAGYHSSFFVALHEIGHALGLTHPGPYNDVGVYVYGVTNVYPEDTRQYTLMSYFNKFEVEDATGEVAFSQHLTTTPLLHDIAAIQSIYGAAPSVRADNTVYGYNSDVTYNILGITFRPFEFTEDEIKQFSIYDTGGIDTIDASDVPRGVVGSDGARPILGYSNQIISLEQGTFSSIGSVLNSAGFVVGHGLNNVSIAYGSIIENAIGGGGDDTIIGNSVANRLEGGEGNDRIFGMGGNDIIDGGRGSDLIDGGSGFDTVSYETALLPIIRLPDRLEGDLFNDTLISIEAYKLTRFNDIFWGFAGDDVIEGLGGYDEISGQGGNDRLFGGDLDDYLMGDAGNDTLSGDFGDDLLLGGIGDDILDGGAGLDRMYGGDGNDTYFVDNLGDVIVESGTTYGGVGGIDRVVSSVSHVLAAGVENLTLSLASTALNATGNNLNNELRGNSFNNVLNGGLGADLMVGGGGNDTYIVDNAGDIVDESLGSGTDTVQSSVSFNITANFGQTRGNVEHLTLTGSAAINGTGNALDNIIFGNSANNVLQGLDGFDKLYGFTGNDSIYGGGGDDYMSGGTGNDYLAGSTGNDTYDFTRGSFLFTNLGSDTIADTGGFDRILIDSMSQLRSVVRSGYDAILTFDQGTIRVVNHFLSQAIESIEETGKSVVFATGLIGGNLSGIITGTKKSELLDGKGGDDYLFAGKGNDTLLGGEGNDRLDGEKGNDRLDGGTGDDILTGGSGRDTFVFAKGYGHDTVTDFNLFVDKLALFDLDDSVLIINHTEYGYELDFGEGDVLTLNMPQSQLPGSQYWFDPLAEKWLDNVVSDIA